MLSKWSWKKPLLLICKILGLFANTLTAEDKYSFFNKDSLTQPIQMQLSKNQKTFFELLSEFLKSRSNVEHFEKNDEHHGLDISEITDFKKRG